MAGLLANNGKPLGKLRGPFFTNGQNRNDYPCTDASANNAEREDLMQEKVITGGVIGRLDHTNQNPDTNPNDETLVKEAAVNMQKFPRRNNKGQYIGECLILDTPEGQKLYAYCKSGKKPGISYRGGIDQEAYEQGDVEGAWKEFTIEGFDIVYIPAYPECYLELVEDYLDPDMSKEPLTATSKRACAGLDAQGAARAMIKVAASKKGAKEMAQVMAQEKHFTEAEALAINKAIDDANVDGNRRTKEQAKEIGTPYDASPKHTWSRQTGNGTLDMYDEEGIYGEEDVDPITGKKIETLNTGNKNEKDIPVLGLATDKQKEEAKASASRVKANIEDDIDKLAEGVADDMVADKLKKKGVQAESFEINENGDTMLPPLSETVLKRMGLEGQCRQVILRQSTLREHQRVSHSDVSDEQLKDIILQAITAPDDVVPAKTKNYWHLIKENIRLSPFKDGQVNHGLLRIDVTLELAEMVSGYYVNDKELKKIKATVGEPPVSPSRAQAQAAGGADFLQFTVASISLYINDEISQENSLKKNAGLTSDEDGNILLPPLEKNVLQMMGVEGESRQVVLTKSALAHQRQSHPDVTEEQLEDIIVQAIKTPDSVNPAKKENYWHLVKENIRVSRKHEGQMRHGVLRIDITLELVNMVSGYYVGNNELKKIKATSGELRVSPSHAQVQAAVGADFLQFVVASISLYINDEISQEDSQKKNAGIEKGTVADRAKTEDEELEGYIDENGKVKKKTSAGVLGVASEEEKTEDNQKAGDLGADGKIRENKYYVQIDDAYIVENGYGYGRVTDKDKATIMDKDKAQATVTRLKSMNKEYRNAVVVKASMLGVNAEEEPGDEPEVELLTDDGIKELNSEIVKDEPEKDNEDGEETTMNQLVEEITKLTEQITELQELIKSKDADIDNRNSELEKQTASNKQLKAIVATAVDRAQAGKTVIAKNAELQERNKRLSTVIAQMKMQYGKQVEALQSENDDYKEVVAGLKEEQRVRNQTLSVQANALRQTNVDNKVLAGKNDQLGKLCINMVANMLGIDEGKLLANRGCVRTSKDLERVIAGLQTTRRKMDVNYFPVTKGMQNALPSDLEEVCGNVDWNEEDEI